MEELNKLREIYKLKNVERASHVKRRQESAAEHSWSALMLADYFLTKDLDRLKVYELLMYHDLVEIESGDVVITDLEGRKNKKEKESKALEILKRKLPQVIAKKFEQLFQEYEGKTSKEARFAKAIDALDGAIHELDYKEDWKNWTEEFLREHKGPLFEEFPKLKEAHENFLKYAKENGYFD